MAEMSPELAQAMSHSRPQDFIDSVKQVVIAELESLDSSLEIKTTDYFNHSFIPDMSVEWTNLGKRHRRDLFLRFSFESTQAGRDVHALDEFGPIILALREDRDERILREAEQEAGESTKLLLTNMSALSDISGRSDGSRNARRPSDRAQLPLMELVRSNFVRGARGYLTSSKAGRIRRRVEPASEKVSDLRRIQSFSEIAQDLFVSDAAARLTWASQVLYAGLSGDIEALGLDQMDLAELDASTMEDTLGGELSDSELQVLVPYLLRRRETTSDLTFWRFVGSMLTLDRLESMWMDFAGLDLTPLVEANLESWRACRAALSYKADSAEAGGNSSTNITEEANQSWGIDARMLCLSSNSWRFHFAIDKRKLKGRSADGRSANWKLLRERMRNYSVSSVTLQGITRKLQISGEGSTDVFNDVSTVSEHIEDQYSVPRIDLIFAADDQPTAVEVDFPRLLATADRPIPLEYLTQLGFELLRPHLGDPSS